MDPSRLYELIERFHRSNQLPAFVMGVLATLAIGFFLWRRLPLRILSDAARDAELRRLEKQVDGLTAENDRYRSELRHVEKHAEALKVRLFELSGRFQGQTDASKELTTEREQLKDKLQKYDQQRRNLFDRYQKAKRFASRLNEKLDKIAVTDGRIWEAAPGSGAALFRPLSQPRTPILSLVNLKGGVGKTTIAANLAVAMNKHGWRVLVVDLDHQSSLSQLLLSAGEMDDLVKSRRFIHKALQETTDGLGAFRQSIVRASIVPDSEICLVAADEELGDVEVAISHQWQARITDDDVRYRLRTILHSAEIADRFDFILLDCPPRLTTACVNALAASDYVMIPVLPNPLATAAVPRLLRWLQHLRGAACPELSVMGVVGNKVKYYRGSPVKRQQSELDALAPLCHEQWGGPVKFFPPVPMHDANEHRLPASILRWSDRISTWFTSSTRNCPTMHVADLQNFLRAFRARWQRPG